MYINNFSELKMAPRHSRHYSIVCHGLANVCLGGKQEALFSGRTRQSRQKLILSGIRMIKDKKRSPNVMSIIRMLSTVSFLLKQKRKYRHPAKFDDDRYYSFQGRSWLIDHFTVVDLVPQPSSKCDDGDLVLIQTSFALLWKLCLKNTSQHKNNLIYIIKPRFHP